MEEVGFLLPVFSDRSEKFALRPFDSRKAQEFAAKMALQTPFDSANRDEAIGQIVRFSKGCPGAIISIFQMAADPKYVTERHIKLSPLYIDFKLRCAANG